MVKLLCLGEILPLIAHLAFVIYGGIKNTADSIHVALLTILNITAERISEAFRSLISFTAAVNTGESSITLTSAVSLAVT